jgi:hypothetical protein
MLVLWSSRPCYRRDVPPAPIETLWCIDFEICTLRRRDGRYELLLHRDGRLVSLSDVESELATRTLAQEWRVKRNRS